MVINSITSAYDYNLFCYSKSTKDLFKTMKSEFFKISDWLKANKSINIEEINFILCHNYRAKKTLTLKISLIFIDSLEIKQVT